MKTIFFLVMPFIALLIWDINQKFYPKESSKNKINMIQENSKKNNMKIIKIDSIENVYVIYAKKGDSTFKIVSKKETSINCTRIKKGSAYNLKLNSLFPPRFSQKLDVSGIKFNEILIKLEGNGVVWDLFISENLKGLCFIPNLKP